MIASLLHLPCTFYLASHNKDLSACSKTFQLGRQQRFDDTLESSGRQQRGGIRTQVWNPIRLLFLLRNPAQFLLRHRLQVRRRSRRVEVELEASAPDFRRRRYRRKRRQRIEGSDRDRSGAESQPILGGIDQSAEG